MWRIDFFSIGRVIEYFLPIAAKLHITLLIAMTSLAGGLILATMIAAVLIFHIPVLYQLARVFISFIRAIPINIQLFIFFYGIPVWLRPLFAPFGINLARADPIYSVIITYAISSSAFLAIMLQGAFMGVDPGQYEAALSIGMTRSQMFRRVIIPQAYRIALPELGNNIVSNLKNTSLAFTLGIIDMIGRAQAIATRTHHTLEGYIDVAIIYFALCTLLEKGFAVIEKQNRIMK
ncbi:MAG: amino acid ABC transporter permease [Treponema sp.]|jgi:L-cystine transport system permease protein|nr:amino acid ABC transporter permease [Treponema sp.]